MGMVGVELEDRWEWLVLSSSTDGNGWSNNDRYFGVV